MAHLRINISGMTGPACQAKIERALLTLPGMWAAVVCLDQGYADIEYADPGAYADPNLRGRYLETSELASSYTLSLDTLKGMRRLDTETIG